MSSPLAEDPVSPFPCRRISARRRAICLLPPNRFAYNILPQLLFSLSHPIFSRIPDRAQRDRAALFSFPGDSDPFFDLGSRGIFNIR